MFYKLNKSIFSVCSLLLLLWGCENKETKQYPSEGEPVLFAEHIAPIIRKNCSKCHNEEGGAPFNLYNFDQVAGNGKLVQHVIEKRIMPPWPADPNYSHFANETYLTDDEITLIGRWVKEGCKAGDTASLEPYKSTTKTLGGTFSKLIKIPTPFEIKGDNQDRFYVVKFPIELGSDTFLKAVEFLPHQKKLVHHMNAHLINYEDKAKSDLHKGNYFIRQDQSESARIHHDLNLTNDDGTYPTMTPSVCNYLPGSQFSLYPQGIGGYRIHKKSALYLNDIHFGPSAKDELDTSYFRLYFDTKAPTRPVSEFQLGTLGLSPVEPKLAIEPNTVKTFHIKFTVPLDISIVSIVPHMHLIGKKFLAFAIKPSGDTVRLIYIPNWDFRWQYFYMPKKMLPIPRGSTIYVEGVYDNTSENPNNPFSPPRLISEKNGSMKTTDEMFQLILNYVIYKTGDEEIELEE
jgi:mono/diheme cytochrome c family protein